MPILLVDSSTAEREKSASLPVAETARSPLGGFKANSISQNLKQHWSQNILSHSVLCHTLPKPLRSSLATSVRHVGNDPDRVVCRDVNLVIGRVNMRNTLL